MCGRFVSSTPVSMLAEQFLAAEAKAAVLPPRYNVAPTDPVYAVATSGGERRLGTLAWGLVPHWSETASGPRLINLRAETAADRPGFCRMLQHRRCIVPADGFYEWKAMGDDRPKQPFLVRDRDGRPFAFAGLWDVWRDPSGDGAGGVGGPVRTCTILTTEPNALVASVHDRMPVILPPEAWDAWLDPSVTEVGALRRLLGPCPPEQLEMWPVGTDVNSVRNDGPRLVEPLEGHVSGRPD